MNEGVKILLERMKTNPDEFLDRGKWKSLIEGYASYLNPDDYKIIREELNKLHQQRFTEAVMKELLAPEEDDDMGKWFSAQKIGTPRGGATLSPSIPSISLTSRKTQIEAMKVQVRKKATLKKEHETLYGKLKNYLHNDT
jgi:hypothetical protein